MCCHARFMQFQGLNPGLPCLLASSFTELYLQPGIQSFQWLKRHNGKDSSSQIIHLVIYYFFKFNLCVWVSCLCVCLCTTCVPGTSRGQKRVSDPLKLESQAAVRRCVDLDIKPGSFGTSVPSLQAHSCAQSYKYSTCLNHQSLARLQDQNPKTAPKSFRVLSWS